MAPSKASGLSNLPEEVLMQIIVRTEDPHALTATCCSLLAAAQDIHTQAHWWHQHQRKTSLLRLFRWKWLKKASLTVENLEDLLLCILRERSEDGQSSWHGVFAVARASVLLGLPKTFEFLIETGRVDQSMHEGVLIADMLAFNRLDMLHQLQQKIGVKGAVFRHSEKRNTENPGSAKTSNPWVGEEWWTDMKRLAEWWLQTPVQELKRLLTAGALAESFETLSLATDEDGVRRWVRMEIGRWKTVSDWEMESASSASDSEEEEESDSELDESIESRARIEREKMLESYEGLMRFARGVITAQDQFPPQIPIGFNQVIIPLNQPGIDELSMAKLADAIISACKAGIPGSMVEELLTSLPVSSNPEMADTWTRVLLDAIGWAVLEEGSDARTLEALKDGLKRANYATCLQALRACRTLDLTNIPEYFATTLSHFVPSFVEEADESKIAESARGFHEVAGLELSETALPLYPWLPAVLNSGLWLGAAPQDEKVHVYFYELAAREVRAGLVSLLGVQEEE